ncbi:MAG: HPr family phosphocarrier protein [Pseudomonadota bacterium]
MINRQITIVNRLGLHARAAAKLVSCASGFQSAVHLGLNGQRVNGKSIMGVMMLAASQGSTLEVEISGEDETEALMALEGLINDRFGEDQ